ncbi:MAG: RNA-binding protein hfq [Geitlerinemataceae cyanobacterium]
MSVELDTSLPSTRIFQGFIKEKSAIEVRLNDGSTLAGRLAWLDPYFFCVADAAEKQTLVNRDSVATIAPQ